MDIVGVLILINIVAILYYNAKIPVVTKGLYIAIFGYSIYVCCTGKNPIVDIIKHREEGFEENKVLAMKKEIQRVDSLNMYPSDPDSFFMKYIA